jgi:hypothetical protein
MATSVILNFQILHTSLGNSSCHLNSRTVIWACISCRSNTLRSMILSSSTTACHFVIFCPKLFLICYLLSRCFLFLECGFLPLRSCPCSMERFLSLEGGETVDDDDAGPAPGDEPPTTPTQSSLHLHHVYLSSY